MELFKYEKESGERKSSALRHVIQNVVTFSSYAAPPPFLPLFKNTQSKWWQEKSKELVKSEGEMGA